MYRMIVLSLCVMNAYGMDREGVALKGRGVPSSSTCLQKLWNCCLSAFDTQDTVTPLPPQAYITARLRLCKAAYENAGKPVYLDEIDITHLSAILAYNFRRRWRPLSLVSKDTTIMAEFACYNDVLSQGCAATEKKER